jgi:glycosyltransferase involved in cell wall biosynthesis
VQGVRKVEGNVKILHVIDSAGIYGAETVLLGLAEEQIEIGLSPVIGSIGTPGCSEKAIEAEACRRGIPVETFRMRNGLNVTGGLSIARFAALGGYSVLHSHGYKGNILLGLLPRWVRGLPLVVTVHGWTSAAKMTRLKAYEYADRVSLRFADCVVYVSRGLLGRGAQGRHHGGRVCVIENGIPPMKEPGNGRAGADQTVEAAVERFCDKRFVVGSIGRLSAEKRYEDLIEAVGILVKEGLEIRLVILGEGPERKRLENLVRRLGITDEVMMPGYVDTARRCIRFFEVYAISSIREGLPITALEAMQARVPIVSTAVGGVVDVLHYGRAGLLVPPKKPKDLAEALKAIHQDTGMGKRLAEAAFERVNVKYSRKRMAGEYLEVYKMVSKGTEIRT